MRAIEREDATVADAVQRESPAISKAVEIIADALGSGGRLIYVGAGTSGRLAALDAAECPPTFGVPAGTVRAVVAGGRQALTRAVEGAEDSPAQGRRDLQAQRITARDVVVGLSASGATPYVLGALEYAQRLGARTVGVTANRPSRLARLVEIAIPVETGPEIIAGSTRMKAGTAQKMVLNMLSTGAMIRLGRVYDNWMIGVALSNRKLRQRGVRILEEACDTTASRATRALRQAGNDLRIALLMLKAGIRAPEARRRLKNTGGNLRQALGKAGLRATRGRKRRTTAH